MKRLVRTAITSLLLFALLLSSGAMQYVSAVTDLPFTDVPSNHPYYNAVRYVYEEGIMVGTTATSFSPNQNLTRGQLVTILYRISGSTAEISPDFDDVEEGSYFYYPIGWAQYYGIVYGLTDTEFGPDDNVTREQCITILHRYLTQYEDQSLQTTHSNLYSVWADASSLNDYSKPALNWAVNCGILPYSNGSFFPSNPTSRSQCANYFYLLMQRIYSNAQLFADSDLGVLSGNPAEHLTEIVNSSVYGNYQGSLLMNPVCPNVEFAFYNSEIIFVNAHGGPALINLYPMHLESYSSLYASDIDENKMQDVELAYISSCKAGNVFCETLHDVGGAQQVVGFTTTISIDRVHLDRGSHMFNELFFTFYFHEGSTARAAGAAALDYMIENGAELLGCDSFICYS